MIRIFTAYGLENSHEVEVLVGTPLIKHDRYSIQADWPIARNPPDSWATSRTYIILFKNLRKLLASDQGQILSRHQILMSLKSDADCCCRFLYGNPGPMGQNFSRMWYCFENVAQGNKTATHLWRNFGPSATKLNIIHLNFIAMPGHEIQFSFQESLGLQIFSLCFHTSVYSISFTPSQGNTDFGNGEGTWATVPLWKFSSHR